MSTRVVLAGTAGYGARHLATLQRLEAAGTAEIAALVDVRFAENATGGSPGEGGPMHTDDLDAALHAVGADLVVVATPPHTHRALASSALRHGAALYLEKPPVPLLQDLDALELLPSPGQRVEVGFQLARRNVSVLVRAWRSGALGDVRRISAHAALARPDSYYARSGWAGRWFREGTAVFDGALFNPCAHILHSALVTAGEVAQGWQPGAVEAECYSVRDLDGDDLIATRVTPRGEGPPVVAAATTASEEVIEPAVTLHGTQGEITVRHRDGTAWLRRGGTETVIPPPAEDRDTLEAAVTDPSGAGDSFLSLAAVRPYVLTVNAIVQACGEPRRLGTRAAHVVREGERFEYLPGVAAAIDRAASHGRLFSENDESWATAPAHLDVRDYRRFDHPALPDQKA